MDKRLWSWLPAIVWVGITFVVSNQPVVHIPFGAPDYVAHGLNYAILGVLLIWGLANGSWRAITPRVLVSAILLAILLGIGDEFHQSFIPGRDSELKDVIADGVGAAVAACGVAALAATVRRTRQV